MSCIARMKRFLASETEVEVKGGRSGVDLSVRRGAAAAGRGRMARVAAVVRMERWEVVRKDRLLRRRFSAVVVWAVGSQFRRGEIGDVLLLCIGTNADDGVICISAKMVMDSRSGGNMMLPSL